MGRKTIIFASAVLLVAALAVAAAYAYDRSQDGKIAAGVTIDGIDVGGMDAESAERKLRRELLRPVDRPLRAEFGERTWKLKPAAQRRFGLVGIHPADLDPVDRHPARDLPVL